MWIIEAIKASDTNAIDFVNFKYWSTNEEEVSQKINSFPKYVRPRITNDGITIRGISFRINFYETKNNLKNEAGMKRLRKALEVIGDEYIMEVEFQNNATIEELKNFLNN